MRTIPMGSAVKVKEELKDTKYMEVDPVYKDFRKPNAQGVAVGIVPGNGGELLWVRHSDSDGLTAVYWANELEMLSEDTTTEKIIKSHHGWPAGDYTQG